MSKRITIRVIETEEDENGIYDFHPISSIKQEELVDLFGCLLCTILSVDSLTDNKQKAGQVKNNILNVLKMVLDKFSIRIDDIIESAKKWSEENLSQTQRETEFDDEHKKMFLENAEMQERMMEGKK